MANQSKKNPLADFRLRRPPFWLVATFLILIVVSWLPLVIAARRRVSTSELPRIQLMQDMGTQPKYKAQHESPVFADDRADRPTIDGTVARGHLDNDDHYARGYSRRVDPKTGKYEITFYDGFPREIKVDQRLLARGKKCFQIYCSHCHGLDGSGHGPVNERALQLGEPKWVQVANLHADSVKERPDGHIFNTISNGIRNMPGHSGQITIDDRWAIVAYVRALQLSEDAPADLVPPEKLADLK